MLCVCVFVCVCVCVCVSEIQSKYSWSYDVVRCEGCMCLCVCVCMCVCVRTAPYRNQEDGKWIPPHFSIRHHQAVSYKHFHWKGYTYAAVQNRSLQQSKNSS